MNVREKKKQIEKKQKKQNKKQKNTETRRLNIYVNLKIYCLGITEITLDLSFCLAVMKKGERKNHVASNLFSYHFGILTFWSQIKVNLHIFHFSSFSDDFFKF